MNAGIQVDEFVTIAVFEMAFEGEIARTRLEVEGIAAILPDANTLGATGLTIMLGGVRLQVHKSDADRALAILRNDRSIPLIEGESDEFWAQEPDAPNTKAISPNTPSWESETYAGEPCLVCGSLANNMAPLSLLQWFFTILALGLPLLVLQRNRKCEDCGHFWREGDQE